MALQFTIIIATVAISFSFDDPPPAVSQVRHHAITTRREFNTSLVTSHHSIQGDRPELVTVQWDGLSPGMADAWVGLYLAGEDATRVVPLKYNFCNRSTARHPSAASGSLSFRVLNYRADIVFRLFIGWEQPVLIAESPAVAIRAHAHPTGLRLALTGIRGQVAVTWTSAPVVAARLEYEIDPEAAKLSRAVGVVGAEAQTYDAAELCGTPASSEGYRDPGAFYTARIAGIEPSDEVRYRVGSDAAWSEWHSFRGPPASGAAVKIFAFGDLGQHPLDDSAQAQLDPWYGQTFAYGDPGAYNTTQALHADHAQSPADLVLHNGDLSYAMGYSAEWEMFHDNIEPLSSKIPWMVTIGNHERDWPNTSSTTFGATDSGGECGVPTMRRFPAQPEPWSSGALPPSDQPWYVLNIGVVTIVAMSTEHDLSPGSIQYDWFSRALASVDRQVTPWLIVAGHRPYEVDSDWDGDVAFADFFKDAVSELVEGHQVDLVLGGHHHSYQRTCALKGGACVNVGGTIVLNVGMAGAGLNSNNATTPAHFRYSDDQNFGYLRIVADDESLTAEFVQGNDRRVHDSVVLRRQSASNLV